MAPSFDCAVSSLFCDEDNSSVMDTDDVDVVDDRWCDNGNDDNRFVKFKDLPMLGFEVQSDECLDLMIEKENEQHLVMRVYWLKCIKYRGFLAKDSLVIDDYLKRLRCGDLDLSARREIIDWILKVNAHFSFGSLCAYLSINYLDRFLSSYELPKGKIWMMQLLGVTCLSLAAKMEETEVPLSLDLQVGDSKFVFEARTIQRMELFVLSILNWRMQVLTPFSYIDYFTSKIRDDHDKSSQSSSIARSIQLISSTIKGIDFLEFKPSEIAAAVAISIAGEDQVVDIDYAVSAIAQHVQKEKVVKCIELIRDLSLINSSATTTKNGANPPLSASVPKSPIGVLDAATTLSYKSDDLPVVGSCAISSSHNASPATKRRKPNRPYDILL